MSSRDISEKTHILLPRTTSSAAVLRRAVIKVRTPERDVVEHMSTVWPRCAWRNRHFGWSNNAVGIGHRHCNACPPVWMGKKRDARCQTICLDTTTKVYPGARGSADPNPHEISIRSVVRASIDLVFVWVGDSRVHPDDRVDQNNVGLPCGFIKSVVFPHADHISVFRRQHCSPDG